MSEIELVKRLRAMGNGYAEPMIGDYDEAADVIEAYEVIISDFFRVINMGSNCSTPDMIDWVADRLVNIYGESPNVDFVLSLRNRAKALRNIVLSKPQPTNLTGNDE